MKLKTVYFNEYNGKCLTSLCEYDTVTKVKTYISIPNHIARLIINPDSIKELTPTCVSFELRARLEPNYQD